MPPAKKAKPSPKYCIYYHAGMQSKGSIPIQGFQGRIHGALRILEQSGADYEVLPVADMPENRDAAFVVPAVTLPSGVTVGQSTTICQVLGKILNLSPTNPDDEAVALTVNENNGDLFGEAIMKDCADDRLAKWLATYEAALERSGSGYLAGAALSYADLSSYAVISHTKVIDATKSFPLLTKWIGMMKETKGCKTVESWGIPLMPGGK